MKTIFANNWNRAVLVAAPLCEPALPHLGMAMVAAALSGDSNGGYDVRGDGHSCNKADKKVFQIDSNLDFNMAYPQLAGKIPGHLLAHDYQELYKVPGISDFIDFQCKQILSRKPDLIGFHIHTFSYSFTVLIAEKIRRNLPEKQQQDLKIVCGGPAVNRTSHGKSLQRLNIFDHIHEGFYPASGVFTSMILISPEMPEDL